MGTSVTVQVHPSDQGGCGHYRMIWPAEAVTKHGTGTDVTLVPEGGLLDLQYAITPEGPRVCGVGSPPECDVLVLQRPLSRNLADAIPYLQRAGVAVVVELDDDFTAMHQHNIARPDCDPTRNPDRNWNHLLRACSAADWVTVTTPALANRYAKHGRVSVLPNYLPETYRQVTPAWQTDTPVRLCWSGSVGTHPDDLQAAAAGVSPLVQSGEAELHVIGTGVGVGKRLRIPQEHVDAHAVGWVDLKTQYHFAMGQHHLGIVPLSMTPFNEAKSWLKGMEFAGAGVPFLASSTGPYRALADLGVGTVVPRQADWPAYLRRWVRSPDLRAETADRAREVVLGSLMIEQHAQDWEDAWLSAAANRAARRIKELTR